MRTLSTNQLFPSVLLRSALFSATVVEKELAHRSIAVPIAGGLQLQVTGHALGQFDRCTFEAVLALLTDPKTAEFKLIGVTANTSLSQILKKMGRGDDGRTIARLEASLARLETTRLVITADPITKNRGRVSIALIFRSARADNGKLALTVDSDIIKLFSWGTARLSTEICVQLAKKPLASWLYGWVCAHQHFETIYVQKPSRLRELAGCTMSLASFKTQLKTALDELKRFGIVSSYSIPRGDVGVRIRRPGDAPLNSLNSRQTDPTDERSNHGTPEVAIPHRDNLDDKVVVFTPAIAETLTTGITEAEKAGEYGKAKKLRIERRIRAGIAKPGDTARFSLGVPAPWDPLAGLDDDDVL